MIEYAGPHKAMIKVIGVGGGGSNAVNSMLEVAHNGNDYVEFICTNTDAQALQCSDAPTKIQLGQQMTGGLGAGADPQVGRAAAEEDIERLREVMMGAHMVFIAAGMGGGTGTGAAPVVARIAQELGILTVAVVTRPFSIEGKLRNERAERGIEELKEYVDSLITIPNQRLVSIAGDKMTLKECFSVANKVLIDAVYGIIDLIHEPGLINVDFADVRTVMSQHGTPHALMGTGVARGEGRAHKAAQEAISSPLLSNVNIQGAKSLLLNFTGGSDMTLNEVLTASGQIKQDMTTETDVIFGAVCKDESVGEDEIKVTVIATGFDELPQDADQLSVAKPPPRAMVSSGMGARSTPTVGFGGFRGGGAPAPRPSMGQRPSPAQQPVKGGMSSPPHHRPQESRASASSSSRSRPLPSTPSGDRFTGDFAHDGWAGSAQPHSQSSPNPSDPWSDVAPPERAPGPPPPRSPQQAQAAAPQRQEPSAPRQQAPVEPRRSPSGPQVAEAQAHRGRSDSAQRRQSGSQERWPDRGASTGGRSSSSHRAGVYSQDDRFQSNLGNFKSSFGQPSSERYESAEDPYASPARSGAGRPRSSGYHGGSEQRRTSTGGIGSRRPDSSEGRSGSWGGAAERAPDEGIEDRYAQPVRRTPSQEALRQATASRDHSQSVGRESFRENELDNIFDDHELD